MRSGIPLIFHSRDLELNHVVVQETSTFLVFNLYMDNR